MKVLIVDDSPIIRERLKSMLSEVAKVETVSLAKDASEALDSMHTLNPEVIVLDIQMPGSNGIDLLSKIKRKQEAPLVVVLTNLSDTQYRKKCTDAGADYFLNKSTEFDKVTEVLDKY